MENYVVVSLETTIFFARIMKEHALFLQVGFPCKEKTWIQKADAFRQQFEEILREAVNMGDGIIGKEITKSGELVTRFTVPAEQRTSCLTGIPIDCRISKSEENLRPGCQREFTRGMMREVEQLNTKAIRALNGLIDFKEQILREVNAARLFTANYPLLIEHILREARLYRSILVELRQNRRISCSSLRAKEEFWNQIMMEHALFIRGLLDPTEVKLIGAADQFAIDYAKLLEMAKTRDCQATNGLTMKTLEETRKYRDFKAAGAKGILECEIASVILPLLADHVLREANHYIRILES